MSPASSVPTIADELATLLEIVADGNLKQRNVDTLRSQLEAATADLQRVAIAVARQQQQLQEHISQLFPDVGRVR